MTSVCDAADGELISDFDRNGFGIARGLVSAETVERLRLLCAECPINSDVARRGDLVYGIRNLLSNVSGLREMASSGPLIDLAARVLGPAARPVSGIFFDKPLGANWPIAWHQDITIRVSDYREIPGFKARPVKDGIAHMQPPIELSERMLALRIHLDDALSHHGALRVIPGSHRLGHLSNEQVQRQVNSVLPVTCEVQSGDVMLMRPLLLHASSACERPGHRRVIHIEYAAFELPGGLNWQG